MTPTPGGETATPTTLHFATGDLLVGNALERLRELPDGSVHAVVCDPPYGLSDLTPAQTADVLRAWLTGDTAAMPTGRGFMGRSWDAFVPPPALWAECLRVLAPGGHLAAFAGSRTVDLMGLSLRLAGFELRDTLTWHYGSGFPKSLDVSKAIDKRAEVNVETKRRIALVAEVIRAHREAKGMERAEVSRSVVGTPSGACWNWEHHQLPSVEMWSIIKRTLDIPDAFDGLIEGDRPQFLAAERAVIGTDRNWGAASIATPNAPNGEWDITAPATPDAERWQGWGTALKPSHEPIVLARKPMGGTVAATVLAHGTGALNIGASRVGSDVVETLHTSYGGGEGWSANQTTGGRTEHVGRWPANTLFTHAAACTGDVCADGCPVAELDQQSGHLQSELMNGRHATLVGRSAGVETVVAWDCADGCPVAELDRQSGGASRFFPQLGWQPDLDADPGFRYCAKPGKKERNAGLSALPVTDPDGRSDIGKGTWTDKGIAAQHNVHPTVKPVAVMEWLITLLTPPGGTVLDPFLGSGTTAVAAVRTGFNWVGCEMTPDYLPIIAGRVAHAEQQPATPPPTDRPAKTAKAPAPAAAPVTPGQLQLGF